MGNCLNSLYHHVVEIRPLIEEKQTVLSFLLASRARADSRLVMLLYWGPGVPTVSLSFLDASLIVLGLLSAETGSSAGFPGPHQVHTLLGEACDGAVSNPMGRRENSFWKIRTC